MPLGATVALAALGGLVVTPFSTGICAIAVLGACSVEIGVRLNISTDEYLTANIEDPFRILFIFIRLHQDS